MSDRRPAAAAHVGVAAPCTCSATLAALGRAAAASGTAAEVSRSGTATYVK
jgi:hypothetical protein